jgi:hypothetical protein
MSTPEPVPCTKCDRLVEWCSFCDERCGHELCYQCVIVELRLDVAEPHGHGG